MRYLYCFSFCLPNGSYLVYFYPVQEKFLQNELSFSFWVWMIFLLPLNVIRPWNWLRWIIECYYQSQLLIWFLLGLKLTIPSSYYVVQWNILDVIDSLLQRHIGVWSLVYCNKNLCSRFPLLEELMVNKLLEKVDGTIMHNGILYL